MNKVITNADILQMIDELDTETEQEKIELKVKYFNKIIRWTDEDYAQYDELLKNIRRIKRTSTSKCKNVKEDENGITTRYIGDALEDIVNFIFEKSFLLTKSSNKLLPKGDSYVHLMYFSPATFSISYFDVFLL